MLTFGDLFFINDKEYVHLFSDGETIFAAVILDAERTREVKRVQKAKDKKGTSHKDILFCYVELDTEDYIDCSAHMVTAAKVIDLSVEIIRPSGNRLDDEDLRSIKTEIVESKDFFRPALVEYMESITL